MRNKARQFATLALMAAGTLTAGAGLGQAAQAATVPMSSLHEPSDCKAWSSRSDIHQVEASTNIAGHTVKGANWTDLDCGSLTLQVPKGRQSLVTVWLNAETRCAGPVGGWCQSRILADGAELHPVSTTDDPTIFIWDYARPDSGQFHESSLIRTGMIKCPSDHATATCDVKIKVQVRTNAEQTELWVDDTIVRAERLHPTPLPGPTVPTTPKQLVARHSDKCMDATGTVLVQQQTCTNGRGSQEWTFVSTSDGYYNIRASHNGQCLTVGGGNPNDGVSLSHQRCAGAREQEWRITPTDADYFMIVNRRTSKCAVVSNSSMLDGAYIHQRTCDGGHNQQWRFR
ncbi:hypothetical protein Ssi03_56780 [Sphaerisporangium siamense]|uniref:Ricin B lectin domain-containing protein n=1 Tax=Sphaerisporangium siamense TaxID=795645 RepID=A0A7W7D4U6_9ACTN|nr:RICIN domain-containing protein [Sphaerisporangium siamense]MBB4700273.1 hypothetical protein [Sphaerisporangium siamense]GII87688.1 hypothetical protein Ssi03_56780 [Sphaerisporangium siamense]